ncbi:unnamed protein product [Cylindrotheca closterium]|uniref:J domain-containing protein n=1 Tax=Cylindrotheca closterium TaxID=2856 RepID=A0AAD2FHP8_9STRA|nr:unnamed protein product [Cylindrotheca closterium]
MLDNPYQVLGLSNDASDSEIKKAYHKAALKYHPDRRQDKENNEQDDATEKWAAISEAHEILTDPVKRYDWRQEHENSGSRTSIAKTATPTPTRAKAPSTPSRESPRDTREPSASPSPSTSYHDTKPESYSPHPRRTRQSRSPPRRSRQRQTHSPPRRKRQSFSPSAMKSPRASVRSSSRRHASSSPEGRSNRFVRANSANIRVMNFYRKSQAAPSSAGTTAPKRTMGRMSQHQMPQPPLSAGGGSHQRRRRRRVSPLQQKMPQPPLSSSTHRSVLHVPQGATVETPEGRRVVRQSVRRKKSPAPNMPAAPPVFKEKKSIHPPAVNRNTLDHGSATSTTTTHRKQTHHRKSEPAFMTRNYKKQDGSLNGTPRKKHRERKSLFGINLGVRKVSNHNDSED